MASFNPTLRFFHQVKTGKIDLTKKESLDGVTIPVKAEHVAELRDKMVIRPGDVFIVAYPKCGSTWTQQIVKLIANNGVETGVDHDVFVPWIEHMTLDEIESMSSPRFFKSHLQYSLMAGGGDPENTNAKYISVIRNPKDIAVSGFNHLLKMAPAPFAPTWENHFEKIFGEDLPFGPFYSHFLGWWAHKDASNILILTYEQMKRDPRTAIATIATFLEYSLTDEVIDKIVIETSFDKMKDNKAANKEHLFAVGDHRPDLKFMNKGIIGNWKDKLTAEESARIDSLVAEKMKDSGIVFDYGDD